MRRLISRVGGVLPHDLRHLIVGSPSKPSRLANLVHGVLNDLPGERVACFPCSGVLQGYRMKIDWTRHRSFIYGAWEPEVVNVLVELVRPGWLALDIGAHVGFYTLILSKLVGPHGSVIAFEPLPCNFSVLSENIRMNSCSHARAVNKALLDHTCEMSPDIIDDEQLPGSVPFSEDTGAERLSVGAVSLDDFLRDAKHPTHFMKIDVEGAESLVLKGACNTIQLNHPAMVIEIHHGNSSPDESPSIRQLRDWGYQVRWLNRWKLTSHLLATWGA
jgi:FkbM family methyltransferase